MTIFRQSEKDQGVWFPFFTSTMSLDTGEITYDKPEKNTAEFCFRDPTPFWEDQRRKIKRESKMALNPKSRAIAL